MKPANLDDIRRKLHDRDRAELEALVLASMQLHARTCDVASVEPEGAHAEHEASRHRTDAELQDLITAKSTDDLIDLLAPFALLARALA
ncbi:MAG: hypothetical protein M9894_31425 [Planctomycetes bacterium]|nr:hypothetical protein [Planctomycetota bacterium]